jgi:succinate dehydrogenase (ubiquinone) cytochrome b560 subunit
MAAAVKPSTVFSQNLIRATAVSALSSPATQIRAAATESMSQKEANDLLASQRRQRPVSPHLSIYAYDQTFFIGSIWQRFTGAGFAGALYVFSAAYLVAPLTGWHLESASLATAFAGLPVALKGGVKFFLAWPFVFHLFNGVRHLLWDVGFGFSRKDIKQQGWIFWTTSLLGALGLTFFL